MSTAIKRGLAACLLLLLVGCATTPNHPPPEVVRLSNKLAQLQANERVASNAADQLSKAEAAITYLRANAYELEEDVFQHRVYLADRYLQTAKALGLARYLEHRGEVLARQRDELLRKAATQRAQEAREAAKAQRRKTMLARKEAIQARAKLAAMREKLSELDTRQSDEGLVVTLGDVLFELDKARLKPGAKRSLRQLVRALRDAPKTRIRIEGYTDSTGSYAYNMRLSRERAESVRDYLVAHGIDADLITAVGLGEQYPVATNETVAGRQQNRRVEVIFRDIEGDADPDGH